MFLKHPFVSVLKPSAVSSLRKLIQTRGLDPERGGADRVGAQGDLELMPKDQVLEREIPLRAGGNERMKGKLKQFEHLSG